MSWSRIMRGMISIRGYRGFRPLEDLSVLKPWILTLCFVAFRHGDNLESGNCGHRKYGENLNRYNTDNTVINR